MKNPFPCRREINIMSEDTGKPYHSEMTLDTLIISYRDYYGSYHHHKENMAYVATTLYLAAATWVIFKGAGLWDKVDPVWLLYVLLITGIATGFAFVWWQLDKRDFAADLVEACTIVIAERLAGGLNPPELDPANYKGLCFPQVLVKELERIKKNLKWYEFYKGSRVSKCVTLFIMGIWTLGALVSISFPLIWTLGALVSIGCYPLAKCLSSAAKVASVVSRVKLDYS